MKKRKGPPAFMFTGIEDRAIDRAIEGTLRLSQPATVAKYRKPRRGAYRRRKPEPAWAMVKSP